MRRTAPRSRSDLPWSRLLTEAERRFGVQRLRPGQRELIEAALRRRDVLGLLPTGAGKSLCYQLPSIVLPGVTVVVSPLIALMQDQKEKLDEAAIEAARLDSTLTAAEQREAVEQIRDGGSEIVFVTPERMEKPETLDALAERDGRPAVAALLYRLEDKRVQAFFLGGKYPSREDAWRVYDALRTPDAASAGLTAAEVAAAADLGEKRAQVILASLVAAGVLERRRGRHVRVRSFGTLAELDAFQHAYEERRALDRQRLEAMMRYAEITTCRTRYLRAYFSEPEGDDCGHCDNCRDHPATALPARAHAEEASAAHQTAPLDLTPPPPLFATGEHVQHAQFGDGEVRGVDEARITVAFAEAGEKVVHAEYLTRLADQTG